MLDGEMSKYPTGEHDTSATAAEAVPAGSIDEKREAEDAPTDPWDGDQTGEQRSSADVDAFVGDFKTPDPDATLQLHPSEMEQRAAAAEEMADGTIELSGAEAEAARRFAELERERLEQEPITQVVRKSLPLSHECRHCGQRITAPQQLRFARPVQGGYRCKTCENVFCHEHSVRVSGLIDTLVNGGRYSCPLCLPEATKGS